MDEERLKEGTYLSDKYFEEQLERIREIRAGERKFLPEGYGSICSLSRRYSITGKRDSLMFYCSKNSKQKIFRNSGCRYVKGYNKKNWITFYTADEAREAGYSECSHCSYVGKLYTKSQNEINQFCCKNALACHMYDGKLWIQTPSSEWVIHPVGKAKKLLLNHKNEDIYRESYSKSPVKGYHHQEITKGSIGKSGKTSAPEYRQ